MLALRDPQQQPPTPWLPRRAVPGAETRQPRDTRVVGPQPRMPIGSELRSGMNSSETLASGPLSRKCLPSPDSCRAATSPVAVALIVRVRADPTLGSLPGWTRRECAPTPKAGFCSLGTMRKLAAPKASRHSATVMAALRSADPSRAERSSRCYRTRRSVASTRTSEVQVEQLRSSGSTGWTPQPLPPAAATAGTAAERRGRDRRATPLEFALHVIGLVQLVSSRAKSRLVDPRCLAAGGRPAELALARLAPRAWPCSPAVCDVERRRIRCCPTAPRRPASRTRGRATCRAPVLEAQSAVAHRALRGSERGRRRRNAAPLSRHRGGPGGPPAITRVRPRSALEMRRCSVARFPSTFRPPVSPRPIPAAAAVHSDFWRFAGISCPPVSFCERSKHPRPSMVRKGSSVRVRQRALPAIRRVWARRVRAGRARARPLRVQDWSLRKGSSSANARICGVAVEHFPAGRTSVPARHA
jgi:hypothetical protein